MEKKENTGEQQTSNQSIKEQAIIKYSILAISFFAILAGVFFGIKYWKEQSEATKINALIEHFKSGGDILCQSSYDGNLVLMNFNTARYKTNGKFESDRVDYMFESFPPKNCRIKKY